MCVCARWWVCAQLSCPSGLLYYFLRRGRCALLHSQTRGGFPTGPLSSLRESVITGALRSLPSSHRVSGKVRWVPGSCSYPLLSPTQQSCTVTRCHLRRAAPDCSASPLTLAMSDLLTGCEFRSVHFSHEFCDSGHWSSVGSRCRVVISDTRVSSVWSFGKDSGLAHC